ncbi:hypothetical protein [Kitasatospora sp. CB02891]|uniref:hypothetical protein n=1 Tax=Kitasatospora sp. CB02891 TaxID=2020329 RepID=UPI0012FE2B56|nr:hypothetical protein [Kitasatospora sp. CB02891]
MTDSTTGTTAVPTQAAPAAGGADLTVEVHYPPVENGIDYLLSVVGHLREPVDRRDLKYAVLHLQAAAECLLKHRLELEHWSLVFANPGAAVRSKLDDGSLSTCDADQTRTRLVTIAGVAISQREDKHLDTLAQLRNRLQHYGRPHDARIDRFTIERIAVSVLEFLVHFMDTEILPRTGPQSEEALQHLWVIRTGIDSIKGYTKARLARLRPELEPVKPHTVQCPHCEQVALVVGDEEEVRCRYCGYWGHPASLAMVYEQMVLGRHAEGAGVQCPNCAANALVRGASTAVDPETEVNLCFSCGNTCPDLTPCTRCGEPFEPDGTELACASCLTFF